MSRPALAILVSWATLSVVLALTTISPAANWGLFDGGVDLDVYRKGAWHVLSGLPLYEMPVDKKLFYTYTPFSAILFVPLDLLPVVADRHYWLAVNIGVLTASVVASWRLLGYRMGWRLTGVSVLIALGCVFLEPVRTSLFFGQINLVLMLLVLSDAAGIQRSRLAGIGTGIAAGIKLTPAYFVLYFLALRQWRVAALGVGAFASTIALGWLLLPEDSQKYWTGTFVRSERVDGRLAHPSNQSVRGAMARVMGEEPALWLWLTIAIVIAALSLWIAVRLYRTDERLLSVTLVGLTTAAVSPFSWTHHWVWVVPLFVWLVDRALRSWRWWLIPAALFVTLGAWPYWYPRLKDPRIGFYLFPHDHPLEVVQVNMYVSLYVALLVGAAILAVRTRRQCSGRQAVRSGAG
ncbi:glycosyltransferase 87 family protein [Mycolicibacterium iranicum]|uniref:Alpha-(1-2)-phosphatidylinositol mannosyltransferase n=1 Tax=Mycolicibacterium iranicum TaxID=912594 RepID=A0A178M201_MYCIR|nr:glycosyltransferase 87 family protein [Mycolicibacterium iranicum]OAN42018.1 hypothetical protein A4X20_02670 [Mycolicibacterium iranicum]